jgi:hypothetical protein
MAGDEALRAGARRHRHQRAHQAGWLAALDRLRGELQA